MLAAAAALLFASTRLATADETSPQAAPTPTAVAAPTPVVPAAGAGCTGSSGKAGYERFWDWLTYRPLERAGCCWCHHCNGCCYPPLYAFFPCLGTGTHWATTGYVHCCNGGCQAPYAPVAAH
jgi:hypothetical protein